MFFFTKTETTLTLWRYNLHIKMDPLCELFDLNIYLEKISSKIKKILSRPEKNVLTYDILDIEDKLISLKVKQRQIKIGYIYWVIMVHLKI